MEAILFVILLTVLLGYGFFWAFMLYEIGTTSEEEFRAAGQSKALWFVVVLVLQFFGTLTYFFMVRPKLKTGTAPH